MVVILEKPPFDWKLRATRELPMCNGLCHSFSSNSQRSESFDGTCKVATMNVGLEDTLAYYSPEEFVLGFKKTLAFQPRVIKKNRASSGAFGSSDWGVRTAARSMARGRVRMVRTWCSWRPMTTMRRSRPWLSSSSSACMAAPTSPVNGPPRM